MRYWSLGFFMRTTRLWAMAHLTCYHCHITCVSRITNSNLYRWSRPRTMPVVAGVAFNATTSDRILLNPFRSKCALKPCGTRAGGQFESQSYPLSINTRIAREICHPKTALNHPQKNPKPLTRWLRSLRDHNHLSAVFYGRGRQSLNRNPLASQRDPTI